MSVAWLAGEVSLLEYRFCAGLQSGDLARAEIRSKVSQQARAKREAGEQILRYLLPTEIPKHSPQFVVLVEADPMIYGEEFVRTLFKEDVPAFAIRVITEQVEEHDGLEELTVVCSEVEVVIFDVIFDELLERPRAVGTVVAQDRERDKVEAETFADKICRHFTSRQRVLGEIPKRLLAFAGLVNSLNGCVLMVDFSKEGVVRAKRELTFEFKVAERKNLFKIFGGCYHVSSSLSA